MFRGVLGDIAEACDPGTEADKVGVYASLLSASGALIGPGPYVRIANTRHPLLIWSLILGRTNAGRKGDGLDTAMTIVRNSLDHDVYAITEGGLSSGEGVIERIRDVADEDDEGGTEDKRLLVIETELATVMAACAREGTKLPGILRQAWAGERLASLNRKRIVASSSHVAIIGHITPREFRAKVRAADLAGGTWNRFLPFYVERRKLLPLPLGLDEETELPRLAKLHREAVLGARELKALQFDEAATNLWRDELYPEFAALDDDTDAADFVQRVAPYCRRVAALTGALDGRALTTKQDLEAAAHLIRYSVASARYALDPAPRNVKLDKLRRAVDEAGDRGLSREQESALFGRHLNAAQLDELETLLLGDTAYSRKQQATAGRTVTLLVRAKKAKEAK